MNLIDEETHSSTQADLKRRLDAFFARYADPKYDLWKGEVESAASPDAKEIQKLLRD